MSAAPETKYTDRDVRESPDLVELAYEYVEGYGGEFEYLIDMKLRLSQGYDLTTPMIRGILNCMRHDPRVSGLPSPLPLEEGVVVEITRPTARRRRRPKWNWSMNFPEACPKTEPHDGHVWRDKETDLQEWCEGVPYAINRLSCRDMRTTVKTEFCAAQGGRFVHRVANTGHWIRWRPNTHEWGFDDILEPTLWVNLVCRYPSVLKNPRLFDAKQAEKISELCGLELCRHCNG